MEELAQRFVDFARAFEAGAPLYSRIARRVSNEPEVLQLMSAAPVTQRIPVLLFASSHHLLLAGADHPLRDHYPNISERRPEGDATDHFADFVLRRGDAMRELLSTRSTQTNEIRRCNWFLFPFSLIERETGPLAHVDVGSSAGLNLLFPNLTFDVSGVRVIGPGRELTIACQTRGDIPLPSETPRIAWSRGLDARPIDLTDDDQVRWLEACVWPEQVDRFTRLVTAISLARRHGVIVERGDAVDDVANLVERARSHGHPVVTTSWVMNYLPPDRRIEFVSELDRLGSHHDLSWVIAESPRETPELPTHAGSDEDITVISLVTWRDGRREARRLATTHPHGHWVNWGS